LTFIGKTPGINNQDHEKYYITFTTVSAGGVGVPGPGEVLFYLYYCICWWSRCNMQGVTCRTWRRTLLPLLLYLLGE